jgi:hypothetical protein
LPPTSAPTSAPTTQIKDLEEYIYLGIIKLSNTIKPLTKKNTKSKLSYILTFVLPQGFVVPIANVPLYTYTASSSQSPLTPSYAELYPGSPEVRG